MRTKIIITTMIFAILSIFFMTYFPGGPGPPSVYLQISPTMPLQETRGDRVEVQLDEIAIATAASDTVATQETTHIQGLSILESRCAQCHIIEWLQKLEKSPIEWEETLIQMEALGIRLSDPEKLTLLDYLISPDMP